MTEPKPPARSSPAFAVAAVSAAGFLALFAGFVDRARRGTDPAIGPAKPLASAEPRKVLRRRVIRRVIVPGPAPAGGQTASGTTAPAGAPAPAAAPAPAPAPPPAPAPAPAPAPVTSSS